MKKSEMHPQYVTSPPQIHAASHKVTVESSESEINRTVENDNTTSRKLKTSTRKRSVEKRKHLCDITYAGLFIMATNV
jgi:hypothetical protein